MIKKYILLLFVALACYPLSAQVIETDVEDDEEEVFDEEDDEEDAEEDAELPDSLVTSDVDSIFTVGGLEVPEGMSADVDALLREWHAQNNLEETTDGEALYPAEPILADPDTYTQRLRRLPSGVDLPYNEIVQRFIEQYAGRLRRSVSYMLGAQNFYLPIFEEALEAYNVPLELKYLPVIESALNPNAVSRVGATGLWQFMIATGKRYGLEVNSMVDDRRDPVKASHAAAHYLHDLYNIYKDWSLVIAAYNCGPGNVNKAIHRAGGVQDYWTIYPYLPQETRGYVPAFIAANYIMNYYCEHGIRPMQATLPAATDTVQIALDLHLQQAADLLKLPIEELRALNPQYRRDIVPGLWRPCALRLPQDKVMDYIDLGDSVYNHRATELITRRSTVAVNDTYVPAAVKKSSRYSRNSRSSRYSRSSRRGSSGRSHSVVRKGDTLGAIARRNGTTVAKLQRLNGIKGSNIRAGQKIRVK